MNEQFKTRYNHPHERINQGDNLFGSRQHYPSYPQSATREQQTYPSFSGGLYNTGHAVPHNSLPNTPAPNHTQMFSSNKSASSTSAQQPVINHAQFQRPMSGQALPCDPRNSSYMPSTPRPHCQAQSDFRPSQGSLPRSSALVQSLNPAHAGAPGPSAPQNYNPTAHLNQYIPPWGASAIHQQTTGSSPLKYSGASNMQQSQHRVEPNVNLPQKNASKHLAPSVNSSTIQGSNGPARLQESLHPPSTAANIILSVSQSVGSTPPSQSNKNVQDKKPECLGKMSPADQLVGSVEPSRSQGSVKQHSTKDEGASRVAAHETRSSRVVRPMLENPLLKMMQQQGTAAIPQDHSGLSERSSALSGRNLQREVDYDEGEDDDDDDDDEYSDERTGSYSSDTSSSSSTTPEYAEKHSDLKNSAPAENYKNHNKSSTKMAAHRNLVARANVQQSTSNFRMHSESKQKTCVDLLRERDIISGLDYEESIPPLLEELKQFNSPPDIMSSTLNVIPNNSSLLSKARLPFGILVHPLKDVQDIPESRELVRCRMCRTYVNPFVTLVDSRRWGCNVCCRYNELPDDFLYDIKSRSYTDGRHRPEMNSPCYEILTTPDQSLRDRNHPTYAFLFDVSFNAIQTGYLPVVCQIILDNLDQLRLDRKAQVCFVTFNSHIHFYNLHHTLSRPQVYHVTDLEDVTPPTPEGLLVNVIQSKEMIKDLLKVLPSIHEDTKEIGNCLGTALKTVCRMLEGTGGRVTVFQTKIPDVGDGVLKMREDPNKRAAEEVQHLKPETDFYKNIAVDCSSKQIGFDLFFLNTQYIDMSSICAVAKFTGGCLEYFPNFHSTSNAIELDRLKKFLLRYMTREVGFEAVLRIRCTRGLSFQMFHGNAFVRSLDLLTLPIINSDASFGVQVSIDENLEDSHAFFQAALLYTNRKGERRLRVENLCLRVTSELTDIFYHANQQAVVAFVAKMAVDRAISTSVKDSREALFNVAYDLLEAFGKTLSSTVRLRQLQCPFLLRALALYAFALTKSSAFRLGISTKLDDRLFALEQLKTLPWPEILQLVYPHFYSLHDLDEKNAFLFEDKVICQPIMLPLSAGVLDRQGAYLMDTGRYMYLWMSPSVMRQFLKDVFGTTQFGTLTDGLIELPVLDNPTSENVRNFMAYLNGLRQVPSPLVLIRGDSKDAILFYEKLIEDRTSDALNMSYIEFVRSLYEKLPTD